MSSHIHRIQQTVESAIKQGRKIAFIGRSVEQNVEVAMRLNMLDIPKDVMIDKRDIEDYRDDQLCLIVAGSQGQEGSSLVRAVFGEHPMVQIKPKDKVLFLADAIPGNEIPYYKAVDELCRNDVDVVYPEIDSNLHQSGHGGALEQQELLKMVNPKYVMPIGGNDRHRVKFVELVAKPVGLREEQVLIPGAGDVLSFSPQKIVRVSEVVKVEPQAVDGLGVGDVGPRVLSDRRTLSEAGMIVIVLLRKGNHYDLKRIQVVSRGFVFMKQADEVVSFIKQSVANIITSNKGKDDFSIRSTIEKKLSRELFKTIRREPLIMAVSVDV